MIAKLLIMLILIKGLAVAQVSNPTLLGAERVFATANTIAVSDAVTPSDNALLMLVFSHRTTSDLSLLTVVDTYANSGAWTIIEGTREAAQADYSFAYSIVSGSPGSGAITATLSGAADRSVCTFFQVTGYNATPILQGVYDSVGTASTMSAVLPSGVTGGSKTISFVSNRGTTTGITPGTNETELSDTTSGGTSSMRLEIQYSSDQTHNWTTLTGGGSHSGGIIEIQQAAAVGGKRRVVVVSE